MVIEETEEKKNCQRNGIVNNKAEKNKKHKDY